MLIQKNNNKKPPNSLWAQSIWNLCFFPPVLYMLVNILGREITHKLGLLACSTFCLMGPHVFQINQSSMYRDDQWWISVYVGIGKLHPAAASPWAHFTKLVSFPARKTRHGSRETKEILLTEAGEKLIFESRIFNVNKRRYEEIQFTPFSHFFGIHLGILAACIRSKVSNFIKQ